MILTSHLNINDLPVEVLLDIFDYFDKDQLLRATKVNKKWKNLIINTSKLMNRIELFVCPASINTLMAEEVGIPHRKLTIHTHKLENLEEFRKFESKFCVFTKYFRESVEYITIALINIQILIVLMLPMTNLTHLEIMACSPLTSFDAATLQVSFLPKLKYLAIKGASSFLKHLKKHSIEELKVIDFHSDETNQNINNFLKTCDQLRVLKFMDFFPHLDDVESYNFQLSTFSVWHTFQFVKGPSTFNLPSILKLIERQKDTLKELNISGFSTNNIAEFAMNKMQLMSLKLDLKKIKYDLGNMQANNSIRKLWIETNKNSMDQMLKVLKLCKGIEYLVITSNTNIMFSSWLRTAATMSHLKSLSIYSFLQVFLPQDLNLNNIETLTVSHIGSDEQLLAWVQLVTRCPNLKKIVVMCWDLKFMQINIPDVTPNEVFLGPENFIFILISLPNLEEIELRGKFPMTSEFADLLVASTNYSKLRKFTFGAEMSIELMNILRKIHHTKLQVIAIKPSIIHSHVRARR
jgi:hypothetical protein